MPPAVMEGCKKLITHDKGHSRVQQGRLPGGGDIGIYRKNGIGEGLRSRGNIISESPVSRSHQKRQREVGWGGNVGGHIYNKSSDKLSLHLKAKA